MLGEATGGSKCAHCVEEKAVNEVVKISGGHGGLNTAVSTAAQIRQLQEKWQAHAKGKRGGLSAARPRYGLHSYGTGLGARRLHGTPEICPYPPKKRRTTPRLQ